MSIGLVGSNFFSLSLLSTANNGIPSLASLSTTDSSSSQLRYQKSENGAVEIVMRHNMNDPKTTLFTEEESNPKWHGKTQTKYIHREYLAHHPNGHSGLSAEEIQCYMNKGSASSNGEILGTSVVTATPVASGLAGLPLVGWLASALAVKKSAELGKTIGADFVDC